MRGIVSLSISRFCVRRCRFISLSDRFIICSTLIKGVVCTKNIKHKRMTSQYKNPRLLILGGALEYQKVPNRLASFNTLLHQVLFLFLTFYFYSTEPCLSPRTDYVIYCKIKVLNKLFLNRKTIILG